MGLLNINFKFQNGFTFLNEAKKGGEKFIKEPVFIISLRGLLE